jgi:hypothetical protein
MLWIGSIWSTPLALENKRQDQVAEPFIVPVVAFVLSAAYGTELACRDYQALVPGYLHRVPSGQRDSNYLSTLPEDDSVPTAGIIIRTAARTNRTGLALEDLVAKTKTGSVKTMITTARIKIGGPQDFNVLWFTMNNVPGTKYILGHSPEEIQRLMSQAAMLRSITERLL